MLTELYHTLWGNLRHKRLTIRKIMHNLLYKDFGYLGDLNDIDILKNIIVNNYIIESTARETYNITKKCSYCSNKHPINQCKSFESMNKNDRNISNYKIIICCENLKSILENSSQYYGPIDMYKLHNKKFVVDELGEFKHCPYCSKEIKFED